MSRRIEGKIDDYFILEDLSLRCREDVDVYKGVHLDGLSMNLMGGGFKEEYISIRQKDFGIEAWDGKTSIEKDKCEGCWDVLENPCFAIFYRASQLHNIKIPYTKQNQVHTNTKLDALKANLSSISKVPDAGKQYGSMKIEHYPTNLNYWHVELREYSEEEEALPKGKKAWVKEIKSFTKIN